ncbi:hypothetical protein ILUMI_04032 [Ignelater luminosus]|uniref:PiggyBac transposable element-derived protein domain-containing protein n=1 Tax=Ignelater luminosus TaxID=2038154 RepID=A0A8K0GHR4_IGNLU|nr:hypothetical protein ILUMI_04032 [Ignelater luminosus]
MVEIKALFELLYMADVKKVQHLNVKDLWTSDGSRVECMGSTMPRERSLLLLRVLRCDNFEDRAEREAYDNLVAIRDELDEFISKCRKITKMANFLLCVVEMLELFRGRCKFPYGIKVFSLGDARTFYTSNIEVYCGHQPNGPYKTENSYSDVVNDYEIISWEPGKTTLDNYFMFIPLAKTLLEKIPPSWDLSGKNKKEIPSSFLVTKRRPLSSSVFDFTKNETIVSYKVNPNKIILILFMLHHDDKIGEGTEDKAKPEMITFHDFTKGGVHVVDGMKTFYSVARNLCKCPESEKRVVNQIIRNFTSQFKQKWNESNRTYQKFVNRNESWLNATIKFPLYNELLEKKRGRERLLFDEASDCSKRMRTLQLRQNYSADELSYAAQMSLRSDSRVEASKLVKEITTASPKRAERSEASSDSEDEI